VTRPSLVRVRIEADDAEAAARVEAAITAAEGVDLVDPAAVYDRSTPRRGRPGHPGLTHTYLTVHVGDPR